MTRGARQTRIKATCMLCVQTREGRQREGNKGREEERKENRMSSGTCITKSLSRAHTFVFVYIKHSRAFLNVLSCRSHLCPGSSPASVPLIAMQLLRPKTFTHLSQSYYEY